MPHPPLLCEEGNAFNSEWLDQIRLSRRFTYQKQIIRASMTLHCRIERGPRSCFSFGLGSFSFILDPLCPKRDRLDWVGYPQNLLVTEKAGLKKRSPATGFPTALQRAFKMRFRTAYWRRARACWRNENWRNASAPAVNRFEKPIEAWKLRVSWSFAAARMAVRSSEMSIMEPSHDRFPLCCASAKPRTGS